MNTTKDDNLKPDAAENCIRQEDEIFEELERQAANNALTNEYRWNGVNVLRGYYLGVFGLPDKFEGIRDGIKVKDRNGEIACCYLDGDLEKKLSDAKVNIGDAVRIELKEKRTVKSYKDRFFKIYDVRSNSVAGYMSQAA